MSIRVRCPKCGNVAEIPESQLGVAFRCGSCGQRLLVNKPSAVPRPDVRPVVEDRHLAETGSKSNYYVAKDGKPTGPFEEAEVLRRIAGGLLSPNDLCWREGMAEWQPIAAVLNRASAKPSPPPIPRAVTSDPGSSGPLFLHIPVTRLIILSIVSIGLYEAYWIYKNWRYIKERDGLNIHPFWRGVFGIFFCHSLLRRIHEDKEAHLIQLPTFSPNGLATGWVILIIVANLVSRAPSIAASIISAFIPSFLCLAPVQNYINSVEEKRGPGQRFFGWSSGHIVCLVIGIIIWTPLLIGLCSEM